MANSLSEAAKWYRKAAEHGHVGAQYSLGVCYSSGEGVNEDEVEAAKWYRKAAEQGHAEAQNSLGECYRDGKGVWGHEDEAIKWWLKAAKQGNSKAQENIDYYCTGLFGAIRKIQVEKMKNMV